MRTRTSLALAAWATAVSITAHAGTPVLGVELGVTTVEQLRQHLGSANPLEDRGTNKWSGGAMYGTQGSAYNIEGLSEVLYIFDPAQKLAGVVMDMAKHRFDPVYKALTTKYKVVEQQRPFVGSQLARFRTADAEIEVNAPHMSFDMQVSYLRHDLLKTHKTQSAAEKNAKQKAEAAQF